MEIMGGVRRWATWAGHFISSKAFLHWSPCANKEAFLGRYLSEASPADILSAPATGIGWEDRERRKKACSDRISPLVNSKVNTVERERKEVYLRLEVRCLQMSFDA